MSAPSSRTYAETYGGVIFWPRNGTLTMQKVVTVPVCGSSPSSVVGVRRERDGPRAGEHRRRGPHEEERLRLE